MGQIQFNIDNFRMAYSAFGNSTCYPDAVLDNNFQLAAGFVSNKTGGCYTGGMNLQQQTMALNLMTAHLSFIFGQIATGQTPGVLTAATIDKISVALQPPPSSNNWQYWLNQSPYGQQLLALLSIVGVGGIYATTGLPGRAGFRGGFR